MYPEEDVIRLAREWPEDESASTRRELPEVESVDDSREDTRCTICGKQLMVMLRGHEGGLGETWICPLHGTRGAPR